MLVYQTSALTNFAILQLKIMWLMLESNQPTTDYDSAARTDMRTSHLVVVVGFEPTLQCP